MYTFLRSRSPDYESMIETDIGREQFEKFEESSKKKILEYGCSNKDLICR